MNNNYAAIIRNNLAQLYKHPSPSPEIRLPAIKDRDRFIFQAFGDTCVIAPDGITLGDEPLRDARGIIISLYALHATPAPCLLTPFKAYKEFPDTRPYAGAFHSHTETILVPHTERVFENTDLLRQRLNGDMAPDGTGGDLAFTVNPLPKIFLCYIFYTADEDFPASVTCLYSSNAADYMPVDALADVAEYTSKKIIEIISR